MDETLRTRLGELLGRSFEAASASVIPTSADQLVAAVRAAGELNGHIRVVSGLPPAEPGPGNLMTVSLHRLESVVVDAGSLTARAEAGATVAALRGAVERQRLAVAGRLGARGHAGTHVGSLLALGGAARRALTGIEAVLATGEHIVTGGRMQKDVAPYDLAAVLLGSRGRLGIIVAATFRLAPAGVALPPHEAGGPVATGPLDELIRAAFDPAGRLAAV